MEQKPALRNYRSYRFTFFILLFACSVLRVSAATWYVDGTASGKNNGTSWADAWTSFVLMQGLAPGDTVYISGGQTGSSQTYQIGGPYGQFTDLPGYMNGKPGEPVTYQIGQDNAHNGTAIFNSTVGTAAANFLYGPQNIVFSGDGGDGQMHFSVTNMHSLFDCGGSNNVTVSYVNCGNQATFGDANSANGIHIDHCYCFVNYVHADHASYAAFNGTNYGDNSCDHCTFYVPHDSVSPGDGTDCFQWGGQGFTISNNVVVGYDLAGADGNHQDGEQTTEASTVLIYGNTFLNLGNYAVYGDCYYGPVTDFHIYNNLVMVSEPAVNAGSPGGIIVGTDGGYVGPIPCTDDNVTITNNTIVDMNTADAAAGLALNNVTGHPTIFTNCVIANNAFVNSGNGVALDNNASTTPISDVFLSAAQAALDFASYSIYGGLSNDLHLQSNAILLIGIGALGWTQNGSPSPATPTITSALSVETTIGQPLSAIYAITANNSPTSFGATGLPDGLTINASTGVISGIPAVKEGTYSATISATNAAGSSYSNLQIIVGAGTSSVGSGSALPPSSSILVPVITSTTSVTAIMDSPLSPPYTITASNTPTTFNATDLPQGLTVDTTLGVISGTPTSKAGTYDITISATNAAGSGYAILTLVLNQAETSTNLAPSISVTNANNQVLSSTVVSTARLTNFSARGASGTGPDLLTVGFTIGGADKSILVRGIGPSLAAFGIIDPLQDPLLSLFTGDTLIQSNDGWDGANALINTFSQVGAFALPSNSNDSALLATLSAGSYTAQVTSASGSSGIALGEIYDADTTPAPAGQLINLSARANVGIGGNILVGGFTISGNTQETVLILGIGPTLSQFDVTTVLANPQLTLFDANGNQINSNTGWGGAGLLTSALAQAGAFPLADNSNDDALLVTLSPGSYSAEISGVNGASGIALLEIYAMP